MIRILTVFIMLCAMPGSALGLVNNQALVLMQEDIHQAVAVIRPSVVSIRAKKRYVTAGDQQGAVWYESIGAGFIVDERGYILTNYHVVEDAVDIDISMWPVRNKKIVAELVHFDKKLDLAVLKINAGVPLTPAGLGKSDRLELGDWVLSVGSPFGFDHTFSLGMVSAVGRELIIGGRTYGGMIQTDAVINEGNSGGPLIDINGKVVGIGTAIYAPDGSYAGLGFAIPINRAKHFFTLVTGAVTAALNTPTGQGGGGKLPIDINKKKPNDAIHAKFQDCIGCHVILKKMVVSTQIPLPHAVVGACDVCHIMENAPPAGKAIPVAAVGSLPGGSESRNDFFAGFWQHHLPKSILLVLSAAILFSMLGLGGGFLYVPILLSCGIDFYTAATTSLLMLTAASASALFIFSRSGLIDWKLVLILEIPTMIGAYAGGRWAEFINVSVLYLMFAATLFVAAYFMLKDEDHLSYSGKFRLPAKMNWYGEFQDNVYVVNMLLAVPISLAVGFIGGVLGIAGGWFFVPLMVVLFGVPMRVAVASSSLMVPFTGLAGFMGHESVGHFDPKIALILTVVAVVGAQLGARMTLKCNANLLRVIFAIILTLVAIWMLVRLFLFGG